MESWSDKWVQVILKLLGTCFQNIVRNTINKGINMKWNLRVKQLMHLILHTEFKLWFPFWQLAVIYPSPADILRFGTGI